MASRLVLCGRCGGEKHRTGPGRTGKYCSRACSQALRVRTWTAPPQDCAACGRTFRSPHGNGPATRFCSKRCAAANKARPTRCWGCGTAVSRVDGHPRKFCSAACRPLPIGRRPYVPKAHQAKCPWCGVIFETNRARYCSKAHARKAHTRAHHLRQRGLAKAGLISLPRIFTRDRGRCGLCGKQVNPRYEPNDRRSATLDHIVPLGLGGLHESRNVQLAHFGCNSAKRTRLCGSQLRLLG